MYPKKRFLARILLALLFHVNLFCFAQQKLTLQHVIDSAYAKNVLLKITKLKVSLAKADVYNIVNIKPTQIFYGKGNFYSSYSDRQFEIDQNFGSPFSWIANRNLVRNSIELEKSEGQLDELRIIASIKSAYYECVYKSELLQLLKARQQTFSHLVDLINIQDQNRDSVILDRVVLENEAADAESKTNQAYNELLIAQNNLVKNAFLDSETLPSDTILVMYQIIPATDSVNRIPSRLFNNIYTSKVNLASSKLAAEKVKLTPELFFRYYDHSLNGKNGFEGWQVGISLPIWGFNQAAAIKKAKLRKCIADNERLWQLSENDAIASNLLTELNKYFERLNYYYDYSLYQADLLEKTATNLLQNQKISAIQFHDYISRAYSIRMGFLETLNNYNQNAIELELYAY